MKRKKILMALAAIIVAVVCCCLAFCGKDRHGIQYDTAVVGINDISNSVTATMRSAETATSMAPFNKLRSFMSSPPAGAGSPIHALSVKIADGRGLPPPSPAAGGCGP